MDEKETGPVQKAVAAKLRLALNVEHLEVVNESGKHNVPPGAESHFKVTVVAREFEGKELIERHREVNRILADELAGPVHALSLNTPTPGEWRERGQTVRETPPCLGGGSGGKSGGKSGD